MKNELIKKMNEKIPFNKKYPEFKDLISYDKECDTEFIAVDLIESVLDKHFMRKLKYKDAVLTMAKDMADYRQKVKDAIMKHLSLDKALFNKIKPKNITNLIEELDLE